MSKLNPLITIAIPTYKRPKYLLKALESAVKQEKSDVIYDIIVVNNDPESDMSSLKQYFKNSPVNISFYTNEKNLGMVGNVNRCVELATGEYISFLHDDDLLMPDYMKTISKIVNANPKVACIIPQRYLLFDSDEKISQSLLRLEKKRVKKANLKRLFLSRYFRFHETTEINIVDNVLACQNCYCAPTCGTLFLKENDGIL